MEKEESVGFESLLENMFEHRYRDERMSRIVRRIKRFVEYVEMRDPVDQCILAAIGFITNTAEIKLRHAYHENDEFTKIDASKVMIEILEEASRQFKEAVDDFKKEE